MSKQYDKQMIRKGLTFHIPKWQFSEEEGKALLKLAKEASIIVRNIFEVGCWTGHSTSWLVKIAKKNNGQVTSIDTFNGEGSYLADFVSDKKFCAREEFVKNMTILNCLDYIRILQGRSFCVAEEIMNESIDFMFINGSHKYLQISADINSWWPKIRSGGILCGHDCEKDKWDENHIKEDCFNGVHHGVVKAVFEKFPKANIINKRIWWIEK